jgi:hypothetical protein
MTLDSDDLFGEIPDNFYIALEVAGTSAQDLELGLAEAKRVLESHGVDPRPAFRAHQIVGLMHHDLVEAGPKMEDLEPWIEWARLADIWNDAGDAAIRKASTNLTPGQVVICQFILDWPGRIDKLGTYYEFPHKVGADFGIGQTYSKSIAQLIDFLKDS